ncbi:winged helix DNA-binding domain-containing protein [Microbacterium esteraromaticum]|uniref:Winged helix DNA-binding domain-containing protein n=1 Tax=Microbacterium esteraromaticum TaxID=57043 RepID=A0A7D8A9D4_9MICO|nr:winged helix DNA-binding domain-containing protein [Microbacterium esteraromaticum]QMU97560.1 winged helix DNA-binding domain-containing protein [Microbacterium esteraromaticum]
MDPRGLLSARLRSHRLTAPAATVADASRHMLAVQSQDLLAGRWALGVRTKGSPTLDAVDAAFARGELVRAWTQRGTLHIVPAKDLAWVLSVTAERQRQQAAGRHRALGIDDEVLAAAWRALGPAARDGGCTRAESFALLRAAGIEPSGQRGIHLLFALTIAGLICQGPIERAGAISREQRFVAADDWIAGPAQPDDPLAELFVRYIDGHGPAGVRDFAWWSGLTLGAARDAAERAADRVREVDDGLFAALRAPRRSLDDSTAFALPAFDEYYISYADRTLVCDPDRLDAVGPGKNGMVRATIIEHGRVVGVWSHADVGRGAPAELFDPDADAAAEASALARFARFVGD